MRVHFRNYIRILVILVMTAIVIVIGKCEDTKNSYAKIEQMKNDSQEYDFSIWVNNQQKVNWWYNEQDNSYYLFIPGAVKDKKLDLTFGQMEYFYIDDKKVNNGTKYRFTQGHHSIRTGDAADGITYDLEVMFTSGIAALFFDTQSGMLDTLHASKDYSESGSMLIMDSRGNKYFEGDIDDIHCRGNSSYEDTDKKSYTIKLSQKADLFGMGEDRKWILTANAFDDTLLRNTIAFDIAKMLKLSYTPDVQYIDVWANGEFLGNYLLSEKIEVGKNRVNIGNLEDDMMELNGNLEPETLEFFMEQQGRLFSTKGYKYEKELDITRGGICWSLKQATGMVWRQVDSLPQECSLSCLQAQSMPLMTKCPILQIFIRILRMQYFPRMDIVHIQEHHIVIILIWIPLHASILLRSLSKILMHHSQASIYTSMRIASARSFMQGHVGITTNQ